MDQIDIFERLRNGETILPSDPQAYKMREASYVTKKLLIEMNNSSDPVEIRNLLSQITGSKIDDSVTVFTPLYINYGKHTKIGKNVFINFNCTFLDLGQGVCCTLLVAQYQKTALTLAPISSLYEVEFIRSL